MPAQVAALRQFAIACFAGVVLLGHAPEADARSKSARAEFQRANPCPANGATRGPCPGHQVDHKDALICGGRDELDNLQWLTIEEHKAKTRVEVKLCRPNLPQRRP